MKPQSPSGADTLFGLPLPIPTDTVYRSLGISPEAPAEGIGWAIKALNDQRTLERSQLEERVKATFRRVPGLEEAYAQLDRLRSESGAPPEELRHIQQRLLTLEKEALAIDPGVLQVRQRVKDLEQKISELNQLALDQPEKRRAYDQQHPPLALLKLLPATRDDFMNNPRVLLWLLRREITRFLEARGETVVYASDLDREDFTADFTLTSLLDE